MAYYAQNVNPLSVSMTRDMIDSALHSMLLSNWPLDLGGTAGYGVSVPLSDPVPLDYVIVPDSSSLSECTGATPGTTYLADWFTNVPKFVNCALATVATTTIVSPSTVLNILFPPWVSGAAACSAKVCSCYENVYPSICATAADCPSGVACNSTTGFCETTGLSCTTAADCPDGLACNSNGFCDASFCNVDPCQAGDARSVKEGAAV